MSETLDLWDYRRRVSDMYARARDGGAGEKTWARWRSERDELLATHPQSAVEDRSGFRGIDYFPYQPSWRIAARFEPGPKSELKVHHSGPGSTTFLPIGTLEVSQGSYRGALEVLWLDAYGGGIFVPFRDATSGTSTYAGGRYILDTVKGADLGHQDDEVILDFNYAYHPSCVHSPRWSCPLAPPANTLEFAVEAGERF